MNVKITTDQGEMEFDVPEGSKLDLVQALLFEVCEGAQNTPLSDDPPPAEPIVDPLLRSFG